MELNSYKKDLLALHKEPKHKTYMNNMSTLFGNPNNHKHKQLS